MIYNGSSRPLRYEFASKRTKPAKVPVTLEQEFEGGVLNSDPPETLFLTV